MTLDEELLFIRNWHNGEENVYLTYDLMAGYFIANYLIDSIADFRAFFLGDQIEILTGKDDKGLHPNYEDILDSLCSLLPIKKGIFVHDLLENHEGQKANIHHPLFDTSIKSTVLLSPEYIPIAQVEFIEKLCGKIQNISPLISFCNGVLFVSNHPFNFSFWSRIIKDLPMSERDTTWTEYLRNLDTNFLEDLIDEFELLQTHMSLTEEQIQKIYLVADFLMWTFTSTDTSLKSKSSNALYLFAIKFPQIFLKQFYGSAEINDPTVFEWMTLVLYNVLIFITKSEQPAYENDLHRLATFLAEEVLNAKGRYNTNHLITRGYVYNTLKILAQKFPIIATTIDLKKIKNQFNTLGVINWEDAEDRNKDEYSDGNSLVDYFFNKEKMPYVMVGKGNEYNETPEFKSTRAKLRWRAYQLGYKFQSFGEIDKQIAKYKHYGDAFANTERYADKYIDIAFFEYCGFLDGLKKFKSYDDIGYLRTFKIKNDPTNIEDENPKQLPNERFVKVSYIDTKVSLNQWYRNNTVPDVNPYLIINNFQEKEGEFVLLNCLVHQHSKKYERQIFFKIDTVFVENNSDSIARKAFTEQTKLGWAANSIPNTSHIHESEIPDADIIPYNEFITWHYSNNSKVVSREYATTELIRSGKKLNKKDADSFWNTILNANDYFSAPRTIISGIPRIQIQLANTDKEKTLGEIFKEMDIELRERKIIKKEEQKVNRKIKIFIPVRILKNNTYLCKNIIDYFKLSSHNLSTDLFDMNGTLASFNFSYEVEYVDQESFTYLRKDLLDKYLKEMQLTMVSIVWGERDYYPPDGDWMKDTKNLNQRKWSEFYKAIFYKPEL